MISRTSILAPRSQSALAMTRLYEVWFSRGAGTISGPKFRSLDDARRYAVGHRNDASYAIRNPDGKWELILKRQPDRRAAFR
jgi:hypothetical protein